MNAEGRTALYRFYDDAEQLLYVGVAQDPHQRWQAHRRDKSWWEQVRVREIEWFPSRREALRQEAVEIRTKRPAHNVHPGWTALDPDADSRRLPKQNVRDQPSDEEIIARLDALMAGMVALPSPADRVRIRQECGASQERFAEALGVSRLTISMWERGETEPMGENRRKYGRFLKELGARLNK